jgi:hypothetical protein
MLKTCHNFKASTTEKRITSTKTNGVSDCKKSQKAVLCGSFAYSCSQNCSVKITDKCLTTNTCMCFVSQHVFSSYRMFFIFKHTLNSTGYLTINYAKTYSLTNMYISDTMTTKSTTRLQILPCCLNLSTLKLFHHVFAEKTLGQSCPHSAFPFITCLPIILLTPISEHSGLQNSRMSGMFTKAKSCDMLNSWLSHMSKACQAIHLSEVSKFKPT